MPEQYTKTVWVPSPKVFTQWTQTLGHIKRDTLYIILNQFNLNLSKRMCYSNKRNSHAVIVMYTNQCCYLKIQTHT